MHRLPCRSIPRLLFTLCGCASTHAHTRTNRCIHTRAHTHTCIRICTHAHAHTRQRKHLPLQSEKLLGHLHGQLQVALRVLRVYCVHASGKRPKGNWRGKGTLGLETTVVAVRLVHEPSEGKGPLDTSITMMMGYNLRRPGRNLCSRAQKTLPSWKDLVKFFTSGRP